MTGSGLQSIAPGPSGGPRSVQARGAKKVQGFVNEQASIQGDTVRVSGKDRDTLQQVIATLKAKDFGINMQFTNYRSN
jgi:uncharacterized protein YajQ (UPF0234 family)